MNIWSIIIALAIFILPSLLPGKKNAGKKTSHSVPVPKTDDTLGELFNMDELAEAVPVESSGSFDNGSVMSENDEGNVEEDDLGQPFFSYETIANNNAEPNQGFVTPIEPLERKETAFQFESVDSMPVTTLLGESFDLRKAIIYQTVMQRVSA